MRIAAYDPSRPNVEVKLPLGLAIGPKQGIVLTHIPQAGPSDPELFLTQAEEAEKQSKPSNLIRAILGPHVSHTVAGFGVPVEETKRRLQDGGRWFVFGALHYDDRFSNPSIRVSKYCFSIGFEISASGEINPTYGPCPHWNCADDECEGDKAAYGTETANWQTPPLLEIPPTPPYATPAPFPTAPVSPVVAPPLEK
jgi:hypothetical protein